GKDWNEPSLGVGRNLDVKSPLWEEITGQRPPFDGGDGPFRLKVRFVPEPLEIRLHVVEAVQIEMVEGPRAVVLVDQRKRGAPHFAGVVPQGTGDPLQHER